MSYRILLPTIAFALAAALLALAAACSQESLDDVQPQRLSDVRVASSRYQPRVIEVPAGTEVTWTFDDGGTRHDVKGDGWGSEIVSKTMYAYTFDEPGVYDYVCSLHPNMTGRVIVTDSR